jgi:diguanylate cyclase
MTFSATAIILFVLVSAVEMTLGMMLGWWMRGGRERKLVEQKANVERAIGSIEKITHDVAGHVGRHQSHIQDINQELSALQQPSSDDLQAAMAEIVEVNDKLRARLREAEHKLQEQAKVIRSAEQAARTDSLTQLANRRAFNEQLQQTLDDARQRQETVSLLLIDVDRFKQINDKHGHQVGDIVLQQVAETLVTALPDAQLIARYGGEEFAAILPRMTLSQAEAAAEAARTAVESLTIDLGDQQLKLTISGGVVETLPDDDIDGFLRRADTALYASKEAGRNCTHKHDGRVIQRIGQPPENEAAPRTSPPPRPRDHVSTDVRIDGLTGMPNRRAFSEAIREHLAQARSTGKPLSLVLLDIDHLDRINQRHGESVGDFTLRAVGQILRTALRPTDLAARFEGGAFVLLLPGTSLDKSALVAERLRVAIAHCRLRVTSEELRFTVSAGTAEALYNDDSASLVKRATTALLVSKRAGGDSTHAFDGRACTQVTAELIEA